ncbi:MAG: YqaJ viral recombinase family protein, partial [Selenomonadaceae bacterium]|nr:YqaJ viral recombinase family protein [Selenomonadaceae bacterium]
MSKPVIIVKTTAITHEQWLVARRKGVGGSDSAAVCGLSRYSSPLEVWLQKTGRKPATPDNEAMYFGHLLEPIVREEFARRTGLNAKECPYLMAHAEYPFMLANVDGIVTEKDGTKSV